MTQLLSHNANAFTSTVLASLSAERTTLLHEFLVGNWKFVLEAYIAQKQVKSVETKKTYHKYLKVFFEWMDSLGIALPSLNKDTLVSFIEELSQSGHSQKTINLYIVSLRGFFSWTAEDEVRLYPNIASRLKTYHEQSDNGHVKMHLSSKQKDALMEYMKTRPLRDYVMVCLMVLRGLRTIEVSRINVDDLRQIDNHKILFIQGKGRQDKSRFVVLSDSLDELIKKYMSSRGRILSAGPLFVGQGRGSHGNRISPRTIQKISKDALRAIGIDSAYYTPHSFRHTAGVDIIKNGGTIYDVQQVLGHSSTATSEIYLQSAASDLRMENPPERFLDKNISL